MVLVILEHACSLVARYAAPQAAQKTDSVRGCRGPLMLRGLGGSDRLSPASGDHRRPSPSAYKATSSRS